MGNADNAGRGEGEVESGGEGAEEGRGGEEEEDYTMKKIVHLDLFSGIGGFALAVDNVYGKENIRHIFCEIYPFCTAVLKKHWSDAEYFGDIRELVRELTGLSAEEYNTKHELSTWRQVLERNPDVYERDVNREYSGVLWDNSASDVDDSQKERGEVSFPSAIRKEEPLLSGNESERESSRHYGVSDRKEDIDSSNTLRKVREGGKRQRNTIAPSRLQQTIGSNVAMPAVPLQVAQREQSNSASDKTPENDTKGNRKYGRQSGKEKIKYEKPFIISGGFPCPSFSQAGKRKGTEDARYLWPEMLSTIHFLKPKYVLAENVRGLVTWKNGLALDTVRINLEECGYEVGIFIIPAVAVNAPHRRDRVWIVAYSSRNSDRTEKRGELQETATQQNKNGAQERSAGESTRATDGWWSKRPTGSKGLKSKLAYTNAPNSESERGQFGRRRSRNKARTEKGIPRCKDCNSADTFGKRLERGVSEKYTSTEYSWDENWVEVAQRFCQLDDGLPYKLARFVDDTCVIMGYILLLRSNFYGKKNDTRTREVLSALQKTTTPQAFSELLRRYGEIQKEEILRCSLHGESNDERESKPWSLLSKSEKAQRQEMRKLWHDKLAEYPPYQRGLDGQCSCQFDDIVRELSSPIALAEWKENAKKATDILFNLWKKGRGIGVLYEPLQALQEVWKSLTNKEIGSFRWHYYKRNDDRNPRLKALGNAIVPQVATEIMKAIKYVEDNLPTNA